MAFGKEERLLVPDLRRDRSEPLGTDHVLVAVGARLGQMQLLRIEHVDRRAVLAAAIVALAHALGGVMAFPEQLQQIAQADEALIPDHPHHLGVAGQA